MNEISNEADQLVLGEADALELFVFLLSSARTQLDEPANYASMRLLTAAENLRDFIIDRVSPDTSALLRETIDLTDHAQIYTAEVDDYRVTLDSLCRMMAKHFVDRSGLGGDA